MTKEIQGCDRPISAKGTILVALQCPLWSISPHLVSAPVISIILPICPGSIGCVHKKRGGGGNCGHIQPVPYPGCHLVPRPASPGPHLPSPTNMLQGSLEHCTCGTKTTDAMPPSKFIPTSSTKSRKNQTPMTPTKPRKKPDTHVSDHVISENAKKQKAYCKENQEAQPFGQAPNFHVNLI